MRLQGHESMVFDMYVQMWTQWRTYVKHVTKLFYKYMDRNISMAVYFVLFFSYI